MSKTYPKIEFDLIQMMLTGYVSNTFQSEIFHYKNIVLHSGPYHANLEKYCFCPYDREVQLAKLCVLLGAINQWHPNGGLENEA